MKEQQIWKINYRRGQVLESQHVRASSEEAALAVAKAYCTRESVRFTGKVWPMIVADESILDESVQPSMPSGSQLVGAVGATTGTNGRR